MSLSRYFYPSVILACLALLSQACEEFFRDPDYKMSGKGVFICNQGNFTFGNASLSYYEIDSFRVMNQVFFNANQFPPGDVLQSMTIVDTLGYLVINNSGKILVINTSTFRHTATIGGLTSPRYMLVADHQKAYVSDLYSKSVTIVNPATFEVTGSVFVGSSTEQMVMLGDLLFATGWSMNNKIYKIDTGTDTVSDSLVVALQPNSMVADRNNLLWVLSDGGYTGSPAGHEVAALTLIDPVSFTVLKEFKFPGPEDSPSGLTANAARDTLFFLNGGWTGGKNDYNGVFRMPVDALQLPEEPFIHEGKRLFYGLGIDPQSSDIYVSDALDFLREGWVFRYNPSGMAIDSFRVDIAPGYFCFK